MIDKIDLSIIIPALNERDNIPLIIKNIRNILSSLKIQYEILIVDGGSSDGTTEICKNLGVKVLIQKKRGYAEAILMGLFNSSGDFIITMDADFSHPPKFIFEFLRYKEDADIIIASRYIKGGFSHAGFLRRYVSRFICLLFQYTLSIPVRDITSGFRMYKKDVIKTLEGQDFKSTEFEILVELLIEAYRKGFYFKEISFGYIPRIQGRSHLPNKIIKLMRGYIYIFWKFLKIRNSSEFADYDEYAYYSLNPLQRYWQRKRYKIIIDLINKDTFRDKKFIGDLGCGSSKIIQSLPDAVALDISLEKLRYIRKSNRFLINASINNLPFKDNVFYCVICSEVIEHVKGHNFFKEIRRIIVPGGILIMGTPDYSSLTWKVIEFFYNFLGQGYRNAHVNKYTGIFLKNLLKNYGFEIVTQRYIFNSEVIIKARKI